MSKVHRSGYGGRSNLVNVMSGVPPCSILGQLLFLYPLDIFSTLEEKMNGYADDSTLLAVVPSPLDKEAVTESLNRDLNRFSEWCDFWGIRLTATESNTMISRSRRMRPHHPHYL